jgi:hypothetical protein
MDSGSEKPLKYLRRSLTFCALASMIHNLRHVENLNWSENKSCISLLAYRVLSGDL